MKILDILILIAIIWFAVKGLKKGLIDGIFSILALVIGGWITVRYSDYTCAFLGWNGETKWLLAAGITFLAVFIFVLLIGKICKSIVNFILPDFVDKLLGLVFGGGKVLLFVGILFYIVTNIDTNEKILTPEHKQASFFYKPSFTLAKFLLPQFEKIKELDKKGEGEKAEGRKQKARRREGTKARISYSVTQLF